MAKNKINLIEVLSLLIISFSVGTNVSAQTQPFFNAVVMIDNQVEARPASGINEANAVFEFPVEGGITRMMAVYKEGAAINANTKIGPIRSARPYFARVASAFKAVYAHAGGSCEVLDNLTENRYQVLDMDYLKNAGNFFERKTENGRVAPHNLYTSFGEIESFCMQRGACSDFTAWPWRFSSTLNEVNMFEQNVVEVDYDGSDYDLRWVYNQTDKKYYREIKNGDDYISYVDANGQAVSIENLAIQYAETNSLKELIETEGRALMCRQGKCQNGIWKQAAGDEIVSFYDFNNTEFTFANGKVWINVTANRYFHDIELSTGWNAVSTPRVLKNHQFSTEGTLSNFDIISLNPESVSGWSTMADLGQSEFTPLYGYFIKNKTGTKQILTLNYNKELDPSDKLFERNLKVGWNLIGIANPSYALKDNSASNIDRNFNDNILNSASLNISNVLDFNKTDIGSVAVADAWDAKTYDDINLMNDFRETKAYATYINSPANYIGNQENSPIHFYKPISVKLNSLKNSFSFPDSEIVLADFELATRDQAIYVSNIKMNLGMEKEKKSDILSSIYLLNKDTNEYYYPSYYYGASVLSYDLSFSYIYLPVNTLNNFQVIARVPDGATDGQKYHLSFDAIPAITASFSPSGGTVKSSDISYNSINPGVIEIDNQIIINEGSFTMEMDNNKANYVKDKNILAGEESFVGRIRLTASNEAVLLKRFTLENFGTAEIGNISSFKLYRDEEKTDFIGQGIITEDKLIKFDNLDFDISKNGVEYLYIGVTVPKIDYSVSAHGYSPIAGRTIKLGIATTSNYLVEAIGAESYKSLPNSGVNLFSQTNASMILGAIISNITSAFANGLLSNGTKDIFSFKVTAPESSNIDYDYEPLGIKLATSTFSVSASNGVVLKSFLVERVGGVNGEKNAYDISGATTMRNETFDIDFSNTYGTDLDLIVKPGETAEYVVRAIVSGVDYNTSLQVRIDGLLSNFNYTHNTGYDGVDGLDIPPVYTLLTGVTYVRGGSLTN